jgi:hypothetical protein
VGPRCEAWLIPAYLYGSHIGEGSLTQFLSGVFQEDVRK